ncbi:MAG: threonine--tRNA ligase [Halococcoides sp.]
MRLLFIHSDHLEFEATEEAADGLGETDGVPMDGRMEDCVTVFISVESDDAESIDGVVDNALDELDDVAGQLNTTDVVLYPYAHLSEDLADPDSAKTVMQDLEVGLESEGYRVLRAPFGWYKAFEISCKGHPLSELSRHVSHEAPGEEPEDEPRAPSDWRVLFPDGSSENAIAAKDQVGDDMTAFIEDEVQDIVASEGEEPPHVSLMREKGLVDYDDLSDTGNLRWYPRGKLVRDALIEYVNDLVVEYGGMPVETPIMYDLGARSIDEHAGKFGERQYRFDSGDRRMMLRFAACFGQFSIMRDMHISVNDLPMRIYEMSMYSFRREQRGEVTGLKRLRAFTMPDMHTATEDMDQARAELRAQAKLSLETADDLDLDYVPAIRVTEEFYEDNEAWVEELVADLDTPALLEVIPERHHYWSAKIDFAAIDGLGRPIENPTVQIDVESAERFDIEYSDGTDQFHPPILHYSPSGGIERVVAALLEQTARMDTPQLPTWLSPTQVRFIPVDPDSHTAYCEDLIDRLEDAEIRADVDDRDESVGKRIARAETDWTPYYVVVGDREIESETFGVNDRSADTEHDLTVDELIDQIDEDVGELPRVRRYLPRRVSNHPHFTG